MISKTGLAINLLALSLGLSACVLDGQTKDTESPPGDASVYGQVSVSADHVSTR